MSVVECQQRAVETFFSIVERRCLCMSVAVQCLLSVGERFLCVVWGMLVLECFCWASVECCWNWVLLVRVCWTMIISLSAIWSSTGQRGTYFSFKILSTFSQPSLNILSTLSQHSLNPLSTFSRPSLNRRTSKCPLTCFQHSLVNPVNMPQQSQHFLNFPHSINMYSPEKELASESHVKQSQKTWHHHLKKYVCFRHKTTVKQLPSILSPCWFPQQLWKTRFCNMVRAHHHVYGAPPSHVFDD